MTTILTKRGVVNGALPTPHSPLGLTVDTYNTWGLFDNTYVFAAAVSGLSVPDPSPGIVSIIGFDSSGTWQVLNGTDPAANGLIIPVMQVPWVDGMTQITTDITGDANNDLREFVEAPTPSNSLIYTYLAGALANADPGAGVFGFNSNSLASITAMYVNYKSPSVGSSRFWLMPATVNTNDLPRILRLWSRKDPSQFVELEVTALINHTTYAELTCSVVRAASSLSTIQLSTDTSDTVVEYVSPEPTTGGALKGVRVILNGTTSYTPSAGTASMYVECVGGGGASGGVAGAPAQIGASGGGGGGAYSASEVTSVNAGAHTVAVGAGGTVGTAGNNPGNAGGDTSLTLAGGESGTAPKAKGGGGGSGTASTGTTPAAGGDGGSGGASSTGTGDMKSDGNDGGRAVVHTTTFAISGVGGAGFFGGSARAVVAASNTAGNAGGLYGGGASGAIRVGTGNTAGATGGNGVLRIWEFG